MRKLKEKNGGILKVILILFIVLLLLIILAFGATIFYAKSCLNPVGDGSNQITLVIEEGETFDDVLADLKDQKMIKSELVAKYYAKYKNLPYYAGNIEVNDGMSLDEIFDAISNPNNAKQDFVSITIPEGKWAKEIAEILAQSYNYSEEEFIEKWNDSNYLKTLCEDYEFLNYDDLNNDQYRVKLEGYLFPDTYQMNMDADIDTITRTFLNRFDQMYQEYKEDFDNSEYSIHEIVTLASIVQFESGYEKDMATIASVFYNRLEDGMRLGSSVTVCYALYDDFEDPQDCEVSTDVESPYNTYLNTGLPIGPILNAGEAAFNATLHPENTNYYYFLADINGDGTVYFFETYEEHQAKQEELGLVY